MIIKQSFKYVIIAIGLTISLIGWAYADNPVIPGESTTYYDTKLSTKNLGRYEFLISAKERPSHEVLPIVSDSYFPENSIELTTIVDNIAPSAVYNVKEKTKVDVVFAVGNFNQVETFQNYIPTFTAKIKAPVNNIDARVEQVKTEAVNLQNSFDWISDVSSSIGNISFDNNGTSVNMVGNPSNQGKNAVYILQDTPLLKQTFAFDYTLEFGDSFSQAGVLLNIGKVGRSLKGYCLAITNHLGSATMPGIYEISYNLGANSSQIESIILLKPLNLAQSGRLEVEVARGYIQVSGSGVSEVVKAETNEFYGYGLGFYSEHYSHGCDQIGSFSMNNITLEKTEAKSLGEAIADVNWRADSIRVVVHITDTVPEDIKDTNSADYLYTVQKLLASNAYLINLGTSTNKIVLDELVDTITVPGTISPNNGKKGGFYYNSSITSAMNSSADYIIRLASYFSDFTKYLLVNTELVWETTYEDYEKDIPLNWGAHIGTNGEDKADIEFAQENNKLTPTKNYFTGESMDAERWRFTHYQNHYDNDLGKASFSDIWIDDHVNRFSQTGKYFVNYKRKDNPLASFNPNDAFNEFRYWSNNYDPIVSEENSIELNLI